MKIIGIDEANYSPSLAGDCVVAGYYRTGEKVRGIMDSKQLTHSQRLRLFKGLHEQGLYYIIPATVNAINNVGVYRARNFAIIELMKAIQRMISASGSSVDKIIIDGYFSERWMSTFQRNAQSWQPIGVFCQVKADETVYEVSSASIIARVYADALFEGFGKFYPGYDLEQCHGSPSKKMYAKLREKGPTPYHRINYGKGWWDKVYKGKEK